MKILITGGAGFIGSHLADAYLQDGHEVAVLDNLETGFIENVNSDARFFECDIRDGSTLARCFDDFRPDMVSHHAAQMSVRLAVADPNYDVSINLTGALNVLQNAVRVGAKRFLFASSGGAVYGEPQYLPVDEDHPIAPESPYGLTKFAFEHYLRIWSHLHDITPVILRYANVYGPRQTPHGEAGVVSIFAGKLFDDQPCTIFGDGSMTRDYVHVDDVTAANRAALKKGDNAIVNIGAGLETSTREVFDAVRAAADEGPEQPIYKPERPGEVHNICLANERAKEVLDWRPQVEFREGVRRSVDYLRNERG